LNLKFIIFLILITFSNLTDCYGQFYQGSVQEYGKNRVQYNGFSWKNHNYKRFTIHFSGADEKLAIYVARTLHVVLNDAEEKLDYRFPEKMELIVYGNQSKFRQSNLGIASEESTELAGSSRIVGSKIFVYYPGNHQDLNLLIKNAVYEVILKHMFYGGSWKTQIKSNLNRPMPNWLERGLIDYFTIDWNAEKESALKDLILTKRIYKFNDLNTNEKITAGHAIWKFIEENYGKSSIYNIINLTRYTKNVEKSFYTTIGLDYINLNNRYIDFYKKRYISEYDYQNEPIGVLINIKQKKESILYAIKPSPDNTQIAYVENILGRYKIKVFNKETKKTKTIFSAESKLDRIQDYSYPIIEWHPNGKIITFFTEKKGESLLYFYSFTDKSLTKKVMKGVDKVLSFDYSPSGSKMVVSAVSNGYTDLFIYTISGGTKTYLTQDIFDDLTPRFTDDYHVVFASNRLSDTISPIKLKLISHLPQKNDLFIYNITHAKRGFKYLERLTNTPLVNETYPFPTQLNTIQFLSNQNGLYNRFTAQKDSSIIAIDTSIHYAYTLKTIPLSNCVTSIREQFIDKKTGELTYLVFQNNQYKIYQSNGTAEVVSSFGMTTYKSKKSKSPYNQVNLGNTKKDTSYINNVFYQKEIIVIDKSELLKNTDLTRIDTLSNIKDKFKAPSYRIYKINFAKDYILSQFDNNFLFPNYQVYSGPGSVYTNPTPSGMLKIGASDLFDDYKLLGGLRIPTNITSGGEQLLMIQNLKNRIDHRLLYYRKRSINPDQFNKGIIHDIRYRLSFPFSEILALRSTINIRQDKQVFIPYSDASLLLNNKYNHTTGLNLELVLDNTIPIELNIRKGSRLKIFSEILKGIESSSYTINLGLDLRHYTKIKRNFIWVNRLAGATSLGTKKLLYYMGAVDNWVLRPKIDFNSNIKVDPSVNYGYQTLATPLRGFIQNTRNGNSFMLFTSELRLPVFTYFSTYPLKYDMLKHFQIVVFGDVGSAWTGPHPLSPDNYFNTQIINDNPLTISIQNLREPIIGDFGFGFRSKIMGYFIRLNFGWGIENLEIQKPVTQLSLSLDI